MNNPYFHFWERIQNLRSFSSNYQARQVGVKKYAWAVPSQKAIETIVKYSPLVEMGAGTGYWASLVQQEGGIITCFDEFIPLWNENYDFSEQYHPIEIGGPVNLKDFGDRTLFLCWPPYDGYFAFACLQKHQGETLIYVGEGYGGCTGDDAFFDLLEKEWEEVEVIDIPQWNWIHDCMFIYKRKEV